MSGHGYNKISNIIGQLRQGTPGETSDSGSLDSWVGFKNNTFSNPNSLGLIQIQLDNFIQYFFLKVPL